MEWGREGRRDVEEGLRKVEEGRGGVGGGGEWRRGKERGGRGVGEERMERVGRGVERVEREVGRCGEGWRAFKAHMHLQVVMSSLF